MKLPGWFLWAAALIMGQAASAELELRQPIACALGETCLIQQFMDHDSSAGVQDFRCSSASYDGHKGTDFRVTVEQMRDGVDILAAANGVIMGMRDGMDDRRVQSEADTQSVAGKECGNGMVLRHEGGWETQYCHMKKGSVIGKKGDQVKAGDVIGQVGLSGRTQFAHLHLSVRKDGVPIDPFSPNFDGKSCSFTPHRMLWEPAFADAFDYQPTQIVTLGLADKGPSLAAVMDGRWSEFALKSNAPLVLYGMAVNGKAGDVLSMRVDGPDGVVVDSARPPLAKRKAQWFGFAGKKQPRGGWPAGDYTLTVQILRDDAVLESSTQTITLD